MLTLVRPYLRLCLLALLCTWDTVCSSLGSSDIRNMLLSKLCAMVKSWGMKFGMLVIRGKVNIGGLVFYMNFFVLGAPLLGIFRQL